MDEIKEILEDLPLPAWVIPIAVGVYLLGKLWPGVSALLDLANRARGRLERERGHEYAPAAIHARRREFAADVAERIRTLNLRERWSDERYTELEAEIETQGNRDSSNSVVRFLTGRSELRREKSLSDALANGKHRLVLLQGDPGSGKSVALRHLALTLAEKAARSRRHDTVVPLYINLKTLKRSPGQPIDVDLIEAFVLHSLTTGRTAEVRQFVAETFHHGVRDGTWLFLFDAFDEIPDLLNATEVDETILFYSDAIREFLGGMRKCGGIVASRFFRSPEGLGWPEWHIQPLTTERQIELIRSTDIPKDGAERLIGELPTAAPEIRRLAANPLFLALLCEHVKRSSALPSDTHTVFEVFLQDRLHRDRERILETTGLEPPTVRRVAEQLAFAMCAVEGLGLAPYASELVTAVSSSSGLSARTIESGMEGLTIARLAVLEEQDDGEGQTFDFVHRRFTEYFATCVVLESPEAVQPLQLLTDMSWRETAVTILQLQPESADTIVAEAQRLLDDASSEWPPLTDEEHDAVETGDYRSLQNAWREETFSWPPQAWHVMDLLQSGAGAREGLLTDELRASAGCILARAYAIGRIQDRRWALEVASVASSGTFTGMVRDAFHGSSSWLREAAFLQAARFADIPPDIARVIRRGLVRMSADGTLRRDALTVRAQLMRLQGASQFLAVVRLLRLAPRIDLAAHVAILVSFLVLAESDPGLDRRMPFAAASLLLLSHVAFYATAYAEPAMGASRVGNLLARLSHTASVGLLLLARLGIIVLLSIAFSDEADIGLLANVAWMAFSLYAITWALGAMQSVSEGRQLEPSGWALTQLSLFRDAGLRSSAAILVAVCAVLVLMGLLGAGLGALLALLPDSLDEAIGVAFTLFAIAMAGLWSVVILILVAEVAKAVFRYVHDLLWYMRWRRQESREVTGASLLESLDRQRTRSGALRLVADIRSDRLLQRTADTVNAVDDLARAIQLALHAPDVAGSDPSRWRADVFARWMRADPEARVERLRELGSEFLDELGRLLRDVDSSVAQQTVPAAPAFAHGTRVPVRDQRRRA